MARKTVAEVLASAKKERDKIQKKAIKTVEDLIPPVISGVMPLGPEIVRGIVEVENALMDYAIDRLSAEAGHIPIGPRERPPRRTFDPDNPITRFLQDLEFPERTGPPTRTPLPKRLPPRVRTDPQLINDEIQRTELKAVNKRARKKDGSLKKGWTQRKIMLLAQKQCTKERERLGLCEKPKKKKKRR